MHVGKKPTKKIEKVDWSGDFAFLQNFLKKKPFALQVCGVPNFSVTEELKAVEFLKKSKDILVQELKLQLEKIKEYFSWKAVYSLEKYGYYVEPFWEVEGCDKMSLIFVRKDIIQEDFFPIDFENCRNI